MCEAGVMADGQEKPRGSFSIGGMRSTGKFRMRPTWFFGFPVVEELIERSDGSFVWQKIWHEHRLVMSHGPYGD